MVDCHLIDRFLAWDPSVWNLHVLRVLLIPPTSKITQRLIGSSKLPCVNVVLLPFDDGEDE